MVELDYHTIPSRQKHLFLIDHRKMHTRSSFHQTMRFIRKAVTKEGGKVDFERDVIRDHVGNNIEAIGGNMFESIKWIRSEEGHPLLEIGIAYLGKIVCLVLLRENLYVLGYYLPLFQVGFYVFDGSHKITGFQELGMKIGYRDGPQKEVGIGSIINAVHELNSYDPNFPTLYNYMATAAKALESLFITIAESARFRAIENQIAMTIKNNDTLFGGVDDDDAITLTHEKERIYTDKGVFLPKHARELLENWSHLSTHWCKFVLSNKREWTLDEIVQNKCKIRTGAALREVLAIAKPNIRNIDEFFFKKEGENGSARVSSFFKVPVKDRRQFKRGGRKR